MRQILKRNLPRLPDINKIKPIDLESYYLNPKLRSFHVTLNTKTVDEFQVDLQFNAESLEKIGPARLMVDGVQMVFRYDILEIREMTVCPM